MAQKETTKRYYFLRCPKHLQKRARSLRSALFAALLLLLVLISPRKSQGFVQNGGSINQIVLKCLLLG